MIGCVLSSMKLVIVINQRGKVPIQLKLSVYLTYVYVFLCTYTHTHTHPYLFSVLSQANLWSMTVHVFRPVLIRDFQGEVGGLLHRFICLFINCLFQKKRLEVFSEKFCAYLPDTAFSASLVCCALGEPISESADALRPEPSFLF